MRKNQFTLEDFLDQMGQIKHMGGLGKMLEMLPGFNSNKVSSDELDKSEREFRHMEAIMQSMTPQERRDPSILNASRRQRIAKGAGVSVSQINSLVKKYEEMRKMMKMMNQSPKKMNRILGRFR